MRGKLVCVAEKKKILKFNWKKLCQFDHQHQWPLTIDLSIDKRQMDQNPFNPLFKKQFFIKFSVKPVQSFYDKLIGLVWFDYLEIILIGISYRISIKLKFV